MISSLVIYKLIENDLNTLVVRSYPKNAPCTTKLYHFPNHTTFTSGDGKGLMGRWGGGVGGGG